MSEPLYQLVVRKGPKVGETFLLEAFTLTIGRDPMSDIILNDPEISRQHARITKTESGYEIQDLGSTNGTFIDGERLGAESAALQPGQQLAMGSGVSLTVEAASEDAGSEELLDSADATMVEEADAAEEEVGASEPYDVPQADYFEPEEYKEPAPVASPPQQRPAASPPAYQAAQPSPPLVPTPDEEEAARKKRRNTIIAVTAVLLVCCCCGFLISGYFWWGDLLLEFLESAGALP